MHVDQNRHPQQPLLVLVAFGALTGLLSGLFGIGGGVLLVPLLVLFLRFDQRLAAGTSVAAILPAAIVGSIGYSVQGNVNWIAAVLLAVGIIVGAQIGSYLLSRAPIVFLRWLFMIFMLIIVVNLWIVVPDRDAQIELGLWAAILLVLLGLVTGVLSGLLGIGGGVVVVPILMIFFGASDLVAKGTSLVMLIPGSISGTLGNVRRKNVDLRSAITLGIAAAAVTPIGTLLASLISPLWSNITFSILLVVVLAQMLVKTIRSRRSRD